VQLSAAADHALLLIPVAKGGTVTVTKTFDDLMYERAEVRFESDGVDRPTGQARLTDNTTGFAGFDESIFGNLTRVDTSFQYQISTRHFAIIDDGFGAVSADVTVGERIFIRRNTPLDNLLLNDVVNTTLYSPSCTADTGTGCLTLIEDAVGTPTSHDFSFVGSDAAFFLDTVYIGALFDLALDNVNSTATESWRVAGGTKPVSTAALLEANLSLTYTFDDIAVPVPAAVWLFGTALIGLVGFSKRRKAA